MNVVKKAILPVIIALYSISESYATSPHKNKKSEFVYDDDSVLLLKEIPGMMDQKYDALYPYYMKFCATTKYHPYKDKGVEVFAIGNEFENEEWLEFIIKHDLNWINGSDGGDFTSNFRGLYDVHSTPQTYLLDENKKILSKKMSIESLERMLEYYYKIENKEEPKVN